MAKQEATRYNIVECHHQGDFTFVKANTHFVYEIILPNGERFTGPVLTASGVGMSKRHPTDAPNPPEGFKRALERAKKECRKQKRQIIEGAVIKTKPIESDFKMEF